MTWTAGALVPVILIGFGVAAVVIFALTGFRKWWQVLDAEREAALAPVGSSVSRTRCYARSWPS